jgi:hypothetical protein
MQFSVKVRSSRTIYEDCASLRHPETIAVLAITPAINIGDAFRAYIPGYTTDLQHIFTSSESTVIQICVPKTYFVGPEWKDGSVMKVENPSIEQVAAKLGAMLSNFATL